MELFLALPQGVFEWDGAGKLTPVLGGDQRASFGVPWDAKAAKAAATIVYVDDYSKLKGPPPNAVNDMANVSVGFVGQNVYLFAASEGMASHFMAIRDPEAVAWSFKLRPDEHVLYMQTIGYGDLTAPEPRMGPPPGGPPPGGRPEEGPPPPPDSDHAPLK